MFRWECRRHRTNAKFGMKRLVILFHGTRCFRQIAERDEKKSVAAKELREDESPGRRSQ